MEKIEAAAIKLKDGRIVFKFSPARHSDVMLDISTQGDSLSGAIQGFMTSEGRFVTREEAYKIADAAGQIIQREDVTPTPGTLYTEDLW